MSRYSKRPLNFEGLRTVSLHERGGKVKTADFARIYQKGTGISGLLDSLPRILAGDSFRQVVDAVASARARGRAIIWGLGGHVVKCGLAPVLIDLMESGCATAFSLNFLSDWRYCRRLAELPGSPVPPQYATVCR